MSFCDLSDNNSEFPGLIVARITVVLHLVLNDQHLFCMDHLAPLDVPVANFATFDHALGIPLARLQLGRFVGWQGFGGEVAKKGF